MAYTIKYQGYDVTCDTAADLRALLNEDGNRPGPPPVPLSKTAKSNPAAL